MNQKTQIAQTMKKDLGRGNVKSSRAETRARWRCQERAKRRWEQKRAAAGSGERREGGFSVHIETEVVLHEGPTAGGRWRSGGARDGNAPSVNMSNGPEFANLGRSH